MYSVSHENLGREHYFSLALFFCGKLSQLHDIILSASPSTVSLGSDLPSQHSDGSCLGCSEQQAHCASLVHRRRQEREGFCPPSCSRDRPSSSCTPPTKALPWGSQDKINQRALKEMGKVRHHSLQQVPGEGGSLFSPTLKEFFAFFFDCS